MGLEGLDASLLNRFWLTGDLGSVGNDYATVLQEAGAQAQGVEVEGEQALQSSPHRQWVPDDHKTAPRRPVPDTRQPPRSIRHRHSKIR